MQRRDFLRKGLLLGAAALLPGTGIAAKWDMLSAVPAVLAEESLLSILPAADFIVTDTPHCAVAVMYDARTMDIPMVIAKGTDIQAEQILKIAIGDYYLPVIEVKPLARALFEHVECHSVFWFTKVPRKTIKMLAEVIDYVYRLHGRDAFAEYHAQQKSKQEQDMAMTGQQTIT